MVVCLNEEGYIVDVCCYLMMMIVVMMIESVVTIVVVFERENSGSYSRRNYENNMSVSHCKFDVFIRTFEE